MKPTIVGGLTALIVTSMSGAAMAQSSVTVYGVFDIAAGYKSNHNGTGTHQWSIRPGATGGSRLGFRGQEDLGGGMKAEFKLEHGFNPDTGAASSATTFWNRESWVGLSGNWGGLRLGKQYTPLFEHYSSFDPMFNISNVDETVPYLAYSAGDDPVHKANAVRYGLSVNNFSFSAMGAPSEGTGGRFTGGTLKYAAGPNGIGAYYETRNPPSESRKKVWGVGASYMTGPVILFANYQDHKTAFPTPFEISGRLYSLGAIYPASNKWTYFAGYYHDKQKIPTLGVTSGKRDTFGASAMYSLSKRTSVYGYVDTTKWKGGYLEIMGNSYGTKDRRANLMLGIRHNF